MKPTSAITRQITNNIYIGQLASAISSNNNINNVTFFPG